MILSNSIYAEATPGRATFGRLFPELPAWRLDGATSGETHDHLSRLSLETVGAEGPDNPAIPAA
ncbi:MAG: hypothetical protein FJ144_06765 [Deltaproteobacteria bacterium]|nr:hypothetical protein [Deltaproteobacteria bacterium]